LEDLVVEASLAVIIIHSLSSMMRVELRSIKITASDQVDGRWMELGYDSYLLNCAASVGLTRQKRQWLTRQWPTYLA